MAAERGAAPVIWCEVGWSTMTALTWDDRGFPQHFTVASGRVRGSRKTWETPDTRCRNILVARFSANPCALEGGT